MAYTILGVHFFEEGQNLRKEMRAAIDDNNFIQENISLIRNYNEFVVQQNL
jgi:hypothetical protein